MLSTTVAYFQVFSRRLTSCGVVKSCVLPVQGDICSGFDSRQLHHLKQARPKGLACFASCQEGFVSLGCGRIATSPRRADTDTLSEVRSPTRTSSRPTPSKVGFSNNRRIRCGPQPGWKTTVIEHHAAAEICSVIVG